MPHRVLLLVNSLGHGGTERNVAAYAAHMDRARFVPEVWTILPGERFLPQILESGTSHRPFRRSSKADLLFALRFSRQIAREQADLIHVFQPTIGYYVLLAKKLWGCRTPVVYSEGLGESTRSKSHFFLLRALLRRCAGWIGNSEGSKKALSEYGIPLNKIRVIPNGHVVPNWDSLPTREAIRSELGIPSDAKALLCVGRLIPSKRVEDLLEAAKMLLPRWPKLRLLLAGDGPMRGELSTLAESLGITQAVRFLGMRSDIPKLMKATDVFAFPSESEGQPNAIIEAAMASIPIVGCRIEGVQSVVEENRHALLVRPRDSAAFATAIEETLQNPSAALARAAEAQRWVSQAFSMESTLAKLYRLYDEAINSNVRR